MTETATPPPGETPPEPAATATAPVGETPTQPTDISTLPQDVQDLIKRGREESIRHRHEATEWKTKAQGYEKERMTETERANHERDEARAQALELQGELLRFQVAGTKGIPPEAMKFLQGETVKELEASADELLAWKGGPGATPSPLDFGAGARPPRDNGTVTDSSQFSAQLRRAAGR